MNFSVSILGAVTWLCYAVIVGFFIRLFASMYPDSVLAKALLFTVG